jgi:hypothetical protein
MVLLAFFSCGCASHLRNIGAGIDEIRAIVEKLDCHDGAPARFIVDPHCQDGICGVTCAPNRWKD